MKISPNSKSNFRKVNLSWKSKFEILAFLAGRAGACGGSPARKSKISNLAFPT